MVDTGGVTPKKTVPGFAGRLGAVVEQAGGIAAVVKATGISDSQLRRYIAGAAEPPFGNVVALAEHCGIGLEWLAYGGESPSSGAHFRGRIVSSDDVVMIPVLSIRAAAGAGSVNHSQAVVDQFPTPKALLRKIGASVENVQAIRAVGDSMSPTIDDGSLVLVDRAQHDVLDGGIYVVSLGDEVRIKRIHKTMSGRITLRSDGDKILFPDEELGQQEAERLIVHGRVFWAERLL